MIEELKTLLQRHAISDVAVIDDAYDESPQPVDIDDASRGHFVDDIGQPDQDRLREAYGSDAYDNRDWSQLRRDTRFIEIVWSLRASFVAATELFSDFERHLRLKRAGLTPLTDLLQTTLGLTCQLAGREYKAALEDASIVFLDLFLGHQEDQSAIALAIDRIRRVVSSRQQSPPLVVLMSASPDLQELGMRVRDDAELLGCQFRMVRKSELTDTPVMLEHLYDLLTTYPDSLLLHTFLDAWQTALDRAKGAFLRTIRTLDLADYANMQALTLDAEDEPVGDYVVDLYDVHLHSLLEGDENLIRSAKALNAIDWASYPPAQFMPSDAAMDMMDGAIFHNEVRTKIEGDIQADPRTVHLGDVFLAPAQPAAPPLEMVTDEGSPRVAGEHPENARGEGARDAFVVLSQACDLRHGDADRILLLRGVARPYSWKYYDKAKSPRTPVMKLGQSLFTIEWDLLAPETWLLDELSDRLREKGYRRARRFRTPFALQLQQSFVSRLSRVGTLTALPGRHPAKVKVFVRDAGGEARLLTEASAESGDAICLVGRTDKNKLIEWLLLSETFRRSLRNSLGAIPEAVLAAPVRGVRDNLAFFKLFKRGLAFEREKAKGSKPFNETGFDLVQVFTRPTVRVGEAMDRSLNPIVVEIELA
jgi:hypothetical protein